MRQWWRFASRFPANAGRLVLFASVGAGQTSMSVIQDAGATSAPSSVSLSASDGIANDDFGFTVALSGSTALIGKCHYVVGSNGCDGAVYVFSFDGNSWTQQQKLTASDEASTDSFGMSIALSGNTALIGAPYKLSGYGAVYVFSFNGSTWVEQQRLIASDAKVNDFFGTSVALSGASALVGEPNGSNTAPGTAYVFTLNGGTWSQQQELTASDGAVGDDFSRSVALSGSTALIGAPYKNVGGSRSQGAVYVFANDGSMWSQQQELTASDGAPNNDFGTSVALQNDIALVGAPTKANGTAYEFTFNGTSWTQHQELTASDGAAGDQFAFGVMLSGKTALFGAPNRTIGSNAQQGAAYVFMNSGGQWVELQELVASDGAANDQFGLSVALSGSTAILGAPYRAVGSTVRQGKAYVFHPVSDTIYFDDFEGAAP